MARLTISQLKKKLRRIKLLALDVDGVLTDDSIYFGPDGFEMKKFHISDGLFMVLAMRAGLEVAIVSRRPSPATDSRMRDLGVKHVLQNSMDKIKLIKPLLERLKLDFDEVAFIGNEIMDIGLARKVGLGLAVADSSPELIKHADFVTKKTGGQGAVREILEYYFTAVEKDPMSYLR
jgi:3-deoxy-D-manno-octulosonate 8-phosphate phosphatase (KDO 8-P phosphatase)